MAAPFLGARMLLVCLLAFALAAPAAAADAPPEAPSGRVQRWLAKAEAAADTSDWETAERFAGRILARQPLGRAWELSVLAQLHRFVADVRERRQQGLMDVPDSMPALEELERRLRRLEESAPQSIILGVARSAIATTRSPELLTVLEPACSEGALSDFHAAEAAFASGRYDDALVAYDAALEACPDNSVWWTWSGDAALRTAGPPEALRRYERALALDPCNHSAHRFVADVGFQLPEPSREDVQRSLRAAVSAVACKPDYAPGWSTLAAWAQVSRIQLVRGTLSELDEDGRKDLLTATALVSEGSPLDRRVAAFEQLRPNQDGPLFGMIGQIEDPELRRSVLAWETLDAATAAEFRALRVEALPLLIEWIARTRLRPAVEAPAPVAPPPVDLPEGLPLP